MEKEYEEISERESWNFSSKPFRDSRFAFRDAFDSFPNLLHAALIPPDLPFIRRAFEPIDCPYRFQLSVDHAVAQRV
jgi:hypothetical protein